MSTIKTIELCCDICQQRLKCSYELVPNARGRTKGGLTKEVRLEAKEKGWTRRKVDGLPKFDICPMCADTEIPEVPWFQSQYEKEENEDGSNDED